MVVFVSACVDDAAPSTTTTATTSATTTTTTGETTTTVGTTVTTSPNGDSGCPGDGAIEDGELLDSSEPSSDAEQISAIGWVGDQACEVFTIEFTTDQGAPATTPPSVEAVFLREVGILRVSIDVEMTSITDQLAETGLVRSGLRSPIRESDLVRRPPPFRSRPWPPSRRAPRRPRSSSRWSREVPTMWAPRRLPTTSWW